MILRHFFFETDTKFVLFDQVENISQSETVEWELQKLNVFTAEQLAGLLDMWRKSHARTYNFYQLSAHAYFKYLQLCANPQVWITHLSHCVVASSSGCSLGGFGICPFTAT